MLAARRAHGGKIAVLMKPSLPLGWFDWVIAPEHDGLSEEPGRFPTIGPINRIQPGQHNAQTGLMLIGGPSYEYGWSETALLKQIHLIALHQPEVTWHLTTSRRTPAGFMADLDKLNLANLQAVAHDKVSADWLPVHLSQASQVWVTPDSASMVYEALTSGAAVGCFEIPFLKPGRVAHGLQKLVRENHVTEFSEWERSGKLKPNTQPLNEAERCAKALLQWLKKD
jgi:mitochondrial fission protein ELM1